MKQILIALDQLLNTLLGGWADETLSARSWRQGQEGSVFWKMVSRVIDCVFFWQENHCKQCWQWEIDRQDLPVEYR